MELKQLEKNKIYFTDFEMDGRKEHIFKVVDILDYIKSYSIMRTSFYTGNLYFNQKYLDNIREARKDECHWLEECIKADKFISKEEALKTFKYTHEAVHCKTQEQWDFVLETLGTTKSKGDFSAYPVNCIGIKGEYPSDVGCHGYKEWYERNNGLVYSFEEWRTKTEETMFKKDDYIVTIKIKNDYSTYNCGKNNHCFKQRKHATFMCPVKGVMSGSETDSNVSLTFDKRDKLLDWRYATKEEIAEYDRLGKPYDVTTLIKSPFKKDDYIVVVSNDECNPSCSKMINYCFKLLKDQSESNAVNCNVRDAGFTFDNSDGGYWIKAYAVRKANATEIEYYNKIGKPYNTLSKEEIVFETPLVKVNDIVVALNGYLQLRSNTVCQVHKSSKRGALVIYHQGQQVGSQWSSFDSFRIATPEEIDLWKRQGDYVIEEPKKHVSKFKAGDKVRFISSSSSNAKYFKKGLENLEIRTGFRDYYSVYESDKSGTWSVAEYELELQTTPSNFIIGKWSVMTNSRGKHYIKVTKIAEKRIDGDTIVSGRYVSGDYWSASDFLKEARVLTDLSEIQDLLPDGHVDKIKKEITMTYEEITRNVGKYVSFYWDGTFIDKALIHKENGCYYLLNNVRSASDGHKDKSVYKYAYYLDRYCFVYLSEIKFIEPPVPPVSAITSEKEFIKGKWYKHLGSSKKYYGKYERHYGSGYIWLTEWISSSGSYGSGGSIEFNSIELADMTEISKYLPKGHKDRIEDPEQYLLEEAKRRYPSGTTYKNLLGGQIFTVVTQSFNVQNPNLVFAEDGKGTLYKDGQWAPIVSESIARVHEVAKTERKRKLPPQEAPIYEVKKVKVIKRTQD